MNRKIINTIDPLNIFNKYYLVHEKGYIPIVQSFGDRSASLEFLNSSWDGEEDKHSIIECLYNRKNLKLISYIRGTYKIAFDYYLDTCPDNETTVMARTENYNARMIHGISLCNELLKKINANFIMGAGKQVICKSMKYNSNDIGIDLFSIDDNNIYIIMLAHKSDGPIEFEIFDNVILKKVDIQGYFENKKNDIYI